MAPGPTLKSTMDSCDTNSQSNQRSEKVCSDLERKVGVGDSESLKRKAASSHDSKAAENLKNAKGKTSVSSGDIKTTRGRKKKEATKKEDTKRSKSKGSSKQSIKRVREDRRNQQREEAKAAEELEQRKRARKSGLPGLENHPGNIIAASEGEMGEKPEDFFWEIESVIGRRIHKGRVEYHIRWKGCSDDDNTWEPAVNLCDTAMEEALKYCKAMKEKERQREEDEKKLFNERNDIDGENGEGSTNDPPISGAENERVSNRDSNSRNELAVATNDKNEADKCEIKPHQDTIVAEDDLWDWTDKDQVAFQKVQRINVNDPNAASFVKEARINGTPIVLVGHVGWANFAKRWLVEKNAKKSRAKCGKSGGKNARKQLGNAAIDAEKTSDQEDSEIMENSSGQNLTDGDELNDGKSSEKESINEVQVMDKSEALTTSSEKNGDSQSTFGPKATSVVEVTVGEKQKRPGMFEEDELLDLSKETLELDLKRMIKDIGNEDVPVIKRHYNEEKPIHGNILASKFLNNCWPNGITETLTPKKTTGKGQKPAPRLYLHQWQFPLSDTAGRKLCHNNNPLPKNIMGEDLLKYWIDLPQCKYDSPLQYIFMGREDTLSKLHKDPGGLDISIAPITGQKECVLVHRSDGTNCLYHLMAPLNEIDLHRYPLLSQARIWRTIIKPGEILLMPQGTYHQCRNVTPCLSYSRFHLDTINLLPFVQSMFDGDAPEIEHEDVLWNLTTELISKVDKAFDEAQSRVKEGLDAGEVSDDIVEAVDLLRTLRHFVREVARREEVKKIVKGDVTSSNSSKDGQDSYEDHSFGMLVDDVDMCLHEFRHRKMKEFPEFKAKRSKALKNTLSGASGGRKDVIKRDLSKFGVGSGKPVVAFNTSLENNYMSLKDADIDKNYPNASEEKVGEVLISQLMPGDKIVVKLEQKHVKGEVEEIVSEMNAAYLSFEDYPSLYDEYQPYELVRLPNGAEIPHKNMKSGLVVKDLSNSNEYRGVIQSTRTGPMARVKLTVSQHEMTRWVSPMMILGRYMPKSRLKQSKEKYESSLIEIEDVAPEPVRPTQVGQIIKVQARKRVNQKSGRPRPGGLATVTKIHYDAGHDGSSKQSKVTHVDARFVVGQSHLEKMIPIEYVALAPESNSKATKRCSPPKKETSADVNVSSVASPSMKQNIGLESGIVSPPSD